MFLQLGLMMANRF